MVIHSSYMNTARPTRSTADYTHSTQSQTRVLPFYRKILDQKINKQSDSSYYKLCSDVAKIIYNYLTIKEKAIFSRTCKLAYKDYISYQQKHTTEILPALENPFLSLQNYIPALYQYFHFQTIDPSDIVNHRKKIRDEKLAFDISFETNPGKPGRQRIKISYKVATEVKSREIFYTITQSKEVTHFLTQHFNCLNFVDFNKLYEIKMTYSILLDPKYNAPSNLRYALNLILWKLLNFYMDSPFETIFPAVEANLKNIPYFIVSDEFITKALDQLTNETKGRHALELLSTLMKAYPKFKLHLETHNLVFKKLLQVHNNTAPRSNYSQSVLISHVNTALINGFHPGREDLHPFIQTAITLIAQSSSDSNVEKGLSFIETLLEKKLLPEDQFGPTLFALLSITKYIRLFFHISPPIFSHGLNLLTLYFLDSHLASDPQKLEQLSKTLSNQLNASPAEQSIHAIIHFFYSLVEKKLFTQLPEKNQDAILYSLLLSFNSNHWTLNLINKLLSSNYTITPQRGNAIYQTFVSEIPAKSASNKERLNYVKTLATFILSRLLLKGTVSNNENLPHRLSLQLSHTASNHRDPIFMEEATALKNELSLNYPLNP